MYVMCEIWAEMKQKLGGITMILANQAAGGVAGMVLWIVILIAFMYFFMIRPQKKEQQQKNAMLQALEIGDTVLTTSGFYGTIIDMSEDTVIIEFGNNKNCRIPMQRAAISAVEKPEDAAKAVEEKKDKKDTKNK